MNGGGGVVVNMEQEAEYVCLFVFREKGPSAGQRGMRSGSMPEEEEEEGGLKTEQVW